MSESDRISPEEALDRAESAGFSYSQTHTRQGHGPPSHVEGLGDEAITKWWRLWAEANGAEIDHVPAGTKDIYGDVVENETWFCTGDDGEGSYGHTEREAIINWYEAHVEREKEAKRRSELRRQQEYILDLDNAIAAVEQELAKWKETSARQLQKTISDVTAHYDKQLAEVKAVLGCCFIALSDAGSFTSEVQGGLGKTVERWRDEVATDEEMKLERFGGCTKDEDEDGAT